MEDIQFTQVAVNMRLSPFAEINAYNRKFWEEQNRLESQRMEQEDLFERARTKVEDEMDRLQVRDQRGWACILREVESDRNCYRSAQTRKARGCVRTDDVLNEFLDRLVRQGPSISRQEVTHELKRPNSGFTFAASDIAWTNNSGENKSAPVKGLKDRLSRAKMRNKKRLEIDSL